MVPERAIKVGEPQSGSSPAASTATASAAPLAPAPLSARPTRDFHVETETCHMLAEVLCGQGHMLLNPPGKLMKHKHTLKYLGADKSQISISKFKTNTRSKTEDFI